MEPLELEKSKNDIKRLMKMGMMDEAQEYLDICFKLYGEESELCQLKRELEHLSIQGITIICFCDTEQEMQGAVNSVDYPKCEFNTILTGEDRLIGKIWDVVEQSESEYIGFWEKSCTYRSDKISLMISYMEEHKESDMVTCYVELVENQDNSKSVICRHDFHLNGLFAESSLDGSAVLEYCINNQVNIFGVLSCFVIRRSSLLRKNKLLEDFDPQGECFPFAFECLYNMKVGGLEEELTSVWLRPFSEEVLRQKDHVYTMMLEYISQYSDLRIHPTSYILTGYRNHLKGGCERAPVSAQSIKKEITFYYTDKGEYYNVAPIANEAEKRGYKIIFTNDIKQKAEIGVYCQHVCFPENAKISVILLHDMAQGHHKWPDIWNFERWNKFDAAILPGKEWEERWKKCAVQYYAHPRSGVFLLGYPKGDVLNEPELMERVRTAREKEKYQYDVTVLYAPSWEYGDKEDDFILALHTLPVNLLIKQASWDPAYAHIIQNITNMRKMHEGKYSNVHYLEPEESIMVALHMCDIVVSDESSVMTEALLLNKPSVAVEDWLIPDTNPPRKAYIPGEHVYKCKKVQLREIIEQMLTKWSKTQTLAVGEDIFCNMGNCNRDIVDLIEYMSGQKAAPDCLNLEVVPNYMPYTLWGN